MGAVTVRQPRVRDIPAGLEPFPSELLVKWERRSRTRARLLVQLYLEGLSTGDFEPIFRALVGETAALSPSSIVRLKEEWADQFRLQRGRPLVERYVYRFADGVYLKACLERENTAVLVVLGVSADGNKELLAMQQGYRESASSWAEVLRDLKARGLTEAPLLAVADGALRFWAALSEVYPETKHQRCWNHRSLNIADKLPKRLHAEAKAAVREIYQAPNLAECNRRRAGYCTKLRATGHGDAADCLERDWEDFVTSYDFPEEHWVHLRTSNPVESIFAGVRARTNATKRQRSRENALYLVFKLVMRLSTNWRPLNGHNQLALLLDGERFDNGRLRRTPATNMESSAA